MKDLRGDAAATVTASSPECFALLSAIEDYPAWHPDVIRRAEVIQRGAGGQPSLARATVHVGIGPLRRDFELTMEVTTIPDRQVKLSRVPHESSDLEQFAVAWQIEPDHPTRLTVELRANLDVPRFVPLQGVGDSLAEGFVAAAQAELERRGG